MKVDKNPEEVLNVEHLSVSSAGDSEESAMVYDVSFHINRGEILILLGESGCGKTILSRALTRIFPITEHFRLDGTVTLQNTSLLDLSENDLIPIRRNHIRYIFQDPMAALNPLAKIRTQMKLACNGDVEQPVIASALNDVGLENPLEVLSSYPHQLRWGFP